MGRPLAVRKVLYVTGTRADFGLMLSTLRNLDASHALDLCVAVTGMHLSAKYGNTVEEVERSGLDICGRVRVSVEQATKFEMSIAVGQAVAGLAEIFRDQQPDIVLLLGDRGEMLAGAIAAMYQCIPVVHIHGGERSGTVDEPVRHAISKLAHYHFVATAQSRERLIRMGERPDAVFVTGAPGLDGLTEVRKPSREEWCQEFGFDPSLPVGLFVYHPVVQEAGSAAEQAFAAAEGALDAGVQLLILMPNADAGGDAVRETLQQLVGRSRVRILTHMQRDHYLVAMASVDVLVGNSSSGIIEAAGFNLPVVNVGTRQKERERSGNVIDVHADRATICAAVRRAIGSRRGPWPNVYGDGNAGARITRLLERLPLGPDLLAKTNAY